MMTFDTMEGDRRRFEARRLRVALGGLVSAVAMIGGLLWLLRNDAATGARTAQSRHTGASDSAVHVERTPSVAERPGRADERVSLVEGGQELDGRPSGEVQFLIVPTRSPAASIHWLFRAPDPVGGASSIEVVADPDGRVRVAAGTWSVSCTSRDLAPLDATVEVAAGRSTTVWVRTIGSLTFQVEDLLQRPIVAANVSWVANRAERDAGRRVAAYTAVTDGAGTAIVADCPTDAGSALVAARGFCSALLPLVGPGSRPIVVVLRPSGEPVRKLQFVGLGDDQPLSNPRVTTAAGHDVSRRSDHPGSVELLDASPDRVLVVDSDDAFPCTFRLADLPPGPVYVRRASTVDVDLESAGPDPRPATLAIRVRSDLVSATLRPVFEAQIAIQPNATTRLSLPAGEELELRAVDDLGRQDVRTLRTTEPTARVVLRPSNDSPVSPVVVVDEAGAPIPDAWGVIDAPAGRIRLECSGVGRLDVPLLDAGTVEIGAPGRARRSFEVRETTQSATEPCRIVLPAILSLKVEVVDLDGRAVPGVRLRAWQPMASASRSIPRGMAECAPSRAFAVTNTRGRARFDRLMEGPVEIDLAMDAVFATDEYGQTLFRAVRSLNVVEGSETQTITVDAPFELGLSVFEESSGIAVAGFQVATRDGSVVQRVDGNLWRGVVCAGSAPLRVLVDGLGTVDVPIERADEGRTLRVLVPALDATELRIDGLTPGVESRAAELRVYRRTASDARLVARVPVRVVNGRARVVLPLDGELLVALDVPGVAIEPPLQEWSSAGTLTFSVRTGPPPPR